jgi:hypothetical protein
MSKNQLDTSDITSELKSGSVFFKKETDEKPDLPERPDGPVRPVRVEPAKREIRRHSFELYRDQVLKLAERKTEIMKTGEIKSMSAMVREAIDEFLEKE